MNQINFEREFDERLDDTLTSDLVTALKAVPTADPVDGANTIWLDTATGKLKVST